MLLTIVDEIVSVPPAVSGFIVIHSVSDSLRYYDRVN